MQRKARIQDFISLMALLCFVLIVIGNHQVSLVDDAYIFERYARNLVQHGELVFNIGERVEGITSFLWTFLLVINAALLKFQFENFITYLSFTILLIFAIRIWWICSRLKIPWLSFAIVLILFSNKTFLISSTNGLEGVLYNYLIFEMLYAFWEKKIDRSLILGGVIFLTRPEGLVFSPLMVLLLILSSEKIRITRIGVLLFILIVLSISVFRLVYYHQIIPNSIISKSIPFTFVLEYGLFSIKNYFVGFLSSWIFFMFVFFYSVGYLFNEALKSLKYSRNLTTSVLFDQLRDQIFSDRDNRVLLLAVTMIVLSVSTVVRNGGDWMPGYRLLTQYASVYVFILIVLLHRKLLETKIVYGYGAVIATLVLLSFPQLQPRLPTISYGSDYYSTIAQRLENNLKKDDWVSAEAIGWIGHLLPDQPIFDPLGLVQKHIARYGYPALTYGKMDIPYTLQVAKPTIIIWHWGGHLKGHEDLVENGYVVFCGYDCYNLNADLVLIRKDSVSRFQNEFNDWIRVENFSNFFGD